MNEEPLIATRVDHSVADLPDGTVVLEGGANNGARVEVDFPFYKGPAGMAPRGDGFDVAYFGYPPKSREVPCDGTIDGVAYRVLTAGPSPISSKMVRCSVERLIAEDEPAAP